jgi:hypothetical protein
MDSRTMVSSRSVECVGGRCVHEPPRLKRDRWALNSSTTQRLVRHGATLVWMTASGVGGWSMLAIVRCTSDVTASMDGFLTRQPNVTSDGRRHSAGASPFLRADVFDLQNLGTRSNSVCGRRRPARL